MIESEPGPNSFNCITANGLPYPSFGFMFVAHLVTICPLFGAEQVVCGGLLELLFS